MKGVLTALRNAGADRAETFALGGVAYCLTRGQPGWKQNIPPAAGAWGVSVGIYGNVPRSLTGQAAQALDIYRGRGLESLYYSDRPVASVVDISIRWWRPSPAQVEIDRYTRIYTPLARQYLSTVKSRTAGISWWVALPVLGILGWLLFKKGK